MDRRIALTLACAVLLLPAAAPAAPAAARAHEGGRLPPVAPMGVHAIDPEAGRAGTTVRVEVSGHFFANEQQPTFRLSLPGQAVIVGETVSFNVFTGETATIRFDLPQAAAPGAYTLTAFQRGRALDATARFTVLPPVPGITAVEPVSVEALGRAFDLRVSGTGFSTSSSGGSVVHWNGAALPTTRDSAVRLTARVSAALIAAPGVAGITVKNGAGGIAETSAPVRFSVLTPVPSITSLAPETAVPGGAAFELSVLGARFLPGAVLVWNGTDLVTRRVSSVLLKATVPTALFPHAGEATVWVRNGAAVNAPQSDFVVFRVAYPLPAITALSPSLVRAGGPAFDLEVRGTRFMTGAAGSVVRWNDTDLVTTRDSAVHLTARVPAALTASEGAADITVRNGPAAAGTVSNALPFTVGVDPAITGLEPATAAAGSGDVTLTVKGMHFVNSVALPLPGTIGSRVEWNGATLITRFTSATRLVATIPAAKLAAAGVAQVTVRNVTEGTVSNSRAFTITDPDPGPGPVAGVTLSALDPVWAAPGGPAFNLGVRGTGFLTGVAGAVVRWNDTDLVTVRDSAVHLTAAVPAALIAAQGGAAITVRNGLGAAAPLSNALTFRVGAAPALALTSIDPSTLWAGCGKSDLELTVNGAGFVPGARIVLAGEHMPGTTYVSAAILTVPIPVSAMAKAGSLKVGVENPPFPPGTAAAGLFPLVVAKETTDPVVTIDGADPGWHNSPVPLTIGATDDQSGVYKIQYRSLPAVRTWKAGNAFTVPVTTEGAIVVDARAYDWCERVGSASVTVNIDTTKPGTAALRDVTVRRGRTARLRFRITEPAGLSPIASVVIRVKRANGTTAKTLRVADAPVNADGSVRFTCNLRRGRYTWYVYATDLAGNPQANVARARLRVR